MTYCVGLTGGIGSGKSTIATLFAGCGATIVDTDVIAHQLTCADGAALPALHEAFGADYFDESGALHRPRMRERVFSDLQAKQNLEAILHPMIRRLAALRVAASTTPYTILVVPLLFESGHYQSLVQRTLVVDCPETTQISRTIQRSRLEESSIRAIMAQQMSRNERRQLADDIIDNNGPLPVLNAQVQSLHVRYLALARGII